MPKESSERIIDWPYTSPNSRAGAVSIVGGGGGGGGASNLDALTDVTLTAPANGQVLSFNSATNQWVNSANAQSVPNPHGLSSSYHNGLLNWTLINFSGSSLSDIATRSHNLLTGIGPNDHHNQAHVLATGTALGPDHTISGAAVGEVLRALTATTAAFDVLQHTDLGNVLPDQHHTRAHDIITGDGSGPVHTVVGADFTVVGVHPANTLVILPTSSNPGATQSVLRTDTSGSIQLDTNLFYVDAANNWIGFNRTPSGATLDVIAAANADHTQRLKQKSGQTGRLWRIEDLSGNELIVLDSVGNLQSGQPGFVSGLTGWQITPQGNAEFNNIWARGELHATVFVKDEVHATGGTLLVATAGVLHDDAIISSSTVDDDVLVVYSTPAGQGVPLQVVTTSGTFVGNELHVSFIGNTININDPPSGPGFYFQPGDVIRSKTEIDTGVTDFWLEVNSATQNSGYSTYSVVKRSGTDGTLPKGSAVVSYGKQGDGRIMLTSDLNYAPYLDVFTVGPNVWTGAAGSVVPRVRLGRLDGVGLPGISGVTQYGLVAGKDLSDANSGYLIASNLQFSLYKIDIRLNNGTSDTGLWTADGNLKIGSNIGALTTTGFQVITTGTRAGDVVIGNEATGYFLRWSQATGQLTVSGNLVVSDPGTTVTKAYVDAQDVSYDNLAQGYGTTAQSNAQSYGDQSRITGVTGTWTSTAANVITWSGLTATFVSGGSRSITAGNTGSMALRTYLYVNVALSGTLTMIPLTTPDVTHPTYVLIAVCDPGTRKAGVTVVAGTTFISGSNIATGSIEANHIVANSIDTGQLTVSYNNSINTISANATQALSDAAAAATAAANAQVYGDNRRIVGVSGTWSVLDGDTISWTGVQVKFANGTARTITANAGLTMIGPARNYLYVDMTGTGTMAMQPPTTSIATINSPNHVLIAVVDTYATPSTTKATINVVAGATYISGGNIVTQSITANNIAANTITANQVDSSVYIAGGGYRVAAISDSFSIAAATPKVVAWGSAAVPALPTLTVQKADGSTVTVTGGSFNTTGQTAGSLFYLYIVGAPTGGTTAMITSNDITTILPTHLLLAIVEAGAVAASYRVVAGGTLITGDQIVTGSITTGNLAAGAVTATKISVDGNINIQGAGMLTIGTTGNIHSGAKTAYADADAGFFLGHSGGLYKLDVGNATNFLRWDGDHLALQMDSPLRLTITPPEQAFIYVTTGGQSDHLGFSYSTSLAMGLFNAPAFTARYLFSDNYVQTPLFIAQYVSGTDEAIRFNTNSAGTSFHSFTIDSSGVLNYDGDLYAANTLRTTGSGSTIICGGDHINIARNRTGWGSSFSSPAGTVGDIAWDLGFIYIYTGATNGWRRAVLNSF